MAESSLYAGERGGGRIFKIGRLGFDQGATDLGAHVYTGTYRSERIAPAGVGALINFRRVAIHLLSSGTYTFTVKIWVDDGRTQLGDATTQTVVISGGSGAISETTEEVEIEATGSHIRVEVTADSDDILGVFLVEGIRARGRVLRRGVAAKHAHVLPVGVAPIQDRHGHLPAGYPTVASRRAKDNAIVG